ncbi:hypothetical protein [Streptomyces sp. NPDC087317]|uniref:hypothetical protein n=1 Tax=Streptomyces sp. NPDC087317 TaxID=3365784 RepID=UPI003823DD62
MNEEHLKKALAAASDAADDTRQLEAIRAVLIAQAVQQGLQAQQPKPCEHHHPGAQPFDTKKWLVIGGVVTVGSLAASLFAVAVAIGAVSVAILALVLRGLWADFQRKGR